MAIAQLGGIASWLGEKFNWLINSFLQIFITPLAMLLYSLQTGFFFLIDCVQSIFRKMAGLDVYYYQGQEQSGDIVLSMITSQTVMTIFYSVLIVAVFLMFVTTFVAIIRTEFTEKGAGNAKGPIIGRAVKSLFYFACVPIVCFFGIWIANVFLKSLDKATSNQSYALSTTVFFAASHDANRARTDSDFANKIKESNIGEYLGLKGTNATQEEIALAIDNAFLQRIETPGDHKIDIGGEGFMMVVKMLKGSTLTADSFDCTNFWFTYYFYDLFLGYSYLIGFMGGFVAAMLLLTSCIAIIQRIYELTILFIISPTVVAFMPMDDGKKYGQWRGEFISRVGMMYGPVIGINLMFIVLNVLRDVDIFPDTGGLNALFNSIVQLIFLIVGLLAVKEFSQLISGLVGAKDAIAAGESKKADVQKMVGRTGVGMISAARFGSQVVRAGKNSLQGSKALRKGDDTARQDIQKGIQDGKYYQKKIGTDEKGNAIYDYKKKDAMGKWKKDSNASEIDLTNPNNPDTLKDMTDKVMSGRDAGIAAHKKAGLGAQLSLITAGQGGKTGIGSTWDAFMQAGGKDLSRYLTRKGVADAAGSGEGIVGNLPIWGKKGEAKTTMAGWDAANKKAKEEKDAREEAEKSQKIQTQAVQDALKNAGVNGGIGAGAAAFDPTGKVFDVNIVGGNAEVNPNNAAGTANNLTPPQPQKEPDKQEENINPDQIYNVRVVENNSEQKGSEPKDNSDAVLSALKGALNDAVGSVRAATSNANSTINKLGTEIDKLGNEISSFARNSGSAIKEISDAARGLANQTYKGKPR